MILSYCHNDGIMGNRSGLLLLLQKGRESSIGFFNIVVCGLKCLSFIFGDTDSQWKEFDNPEINSVYLSQALILGVISTT